MGVLTTQRQLAIPGVLTAKSKREKQYGHRLTTGSIPVGPPGGQMQSTSGQECWSVDWGVHFAAAPSAGKCTHSVPTADAS